MKVFERLTNTLHPMGRLSPRLRSITGETPDPDQDFDLSSLEGTRCQLVIEHSTVENGTTYANISAIIRLKTQSEIRSEDAEAARVKKMTDAVTGRNPAGEPGDTRTSVPIADEDTPF